MEQKLAKTPENILKIANTYDDSERMFRKETRFSEREIFLLNYKMSQANTRNFSQYARIMCLSGLMITTDFSDLKNLTTELGRIGNNINQLTRLANEKIITVIDLKELRMEVNNIWQLLKQLVQKQT